MFNLFKKNRPEEQSGIEEDELSVTGLGKAKFILKIEDVYAITGQGVVAAGKIRRGKATVGETLQLARENGMAVRSVVLDEIEKDRKKVDSASKGESVGFTLLNIKKAEIQPGYYLIK